MKTSLAIVLATGALIVGSMFEPTSGVAAPRYDSYSGKTPGRCGVAPCAYPDQAPRPSRAYGGR